MVRVAVAVAVDGSIMFRLPATRIGGDTTKMMKKIAICALIALVLVPAGVMAVKFGGNSTGAAHGQGQWLQDGQHCMNQTYNQTCTLGSCTPAQYRNGTERGAIESCSGDGLCTPGQN